MCVRKLEYGHLYRPFLLRYHGECPYLSRDTQLFTVQLGILENWMYSPPKQLSFCILSFPITQGLRRLIAHSYSKMSKRIISLATYCWFRLLLPSLLPIAVLESLDPQAQMKFVPLHHQFFDP